MTHHVTYKVGLIISLLTFGLSLSASEGSPYEMRVLKRVFKGDDDPKLEKTDFSSLADLKLELFSKIMELMDASPNKENKAETWKHVKTEKIAQLKKAFENNSNVPETDINKLVNQVVQNEFNKKWKEKHSSEG